MRKSILGLGALAVVATVAVSHCDQYQSDPHCGPYEPFEDGRFCLPKENGEGVKVVKARPDRQVEMAERERELIGALRASIAANPLDEVVVDRDSVLSLKNIVELGIEAIRQEVLNMRIQDGNDSELNLTREELSYLLKLSEKLERSNLSRKMKKELGVTQIYEGLRSILKSKEFTPNPLEDYYLREDPFNSTVLLEDLEGIRMTISAELEDVRYLEIDTDESVYLRPGILGDRRFDDYVAIPVQVKLPKKKGEKEAPPNDDIARIVIFEDTPESGVLYVIADMPENHNLRSTIEYGRHIVTKTTIDNFGSTDFTRALTVHLLDRFESDNQVMFDVVSGREFDENRDDSKGDYLGGYLVEHYSVPTHYFYTSSWRFRKGEICVATDGIKYGISPEDYPVVCDRVLKVDPRNRTFLAYRYDEDGKDQARYDSWEQMRLEVGMRFQWIAPGCCPRTKDYWLQQDERLFYWEPGTRRPLYRIP